PPMSLLCFVCTHSASSESSSLSLHAALPIYFLANSIACVPFPAPGGPRKITARSSLSGCRVSGANPLSWTAQIFFSGLRARGKRSEEHTSELQSRGQLVCRHLPEKKKSCKPR